MRAQASLELFFAVSLFVLVLFWANHFLGVAADASDTAKAGTLRSIAYSLKQSADSACLLNQTIVLPSPCLSLPEPLVINVSGTTLNVSGVSVGTICPFQPSIVVVSDCSSNLCFSRASGALKISEGCV